VTLESEHAVSILRFLRDVANVRQINAAIRQAFERRRQGGPRMARILVVDDDPLIRKMLERSLAAAGHTVVPAADGREARELLAVEPIELVITDIDMPEIDGLQIIASLRREKITLPILALSARSGRDSRLNMATAFGANRTLVKPFDLRQLLDTVEELVGH
jgi:DNA-binding response OmpR family regulator